MSPSRAVFFSVKPLRPGRFVCGSRRTPRSTFAITAVLAREAKWSAEGIEESMTFFFGAVFPVFLGGGERKAQEIGGAGNQTTAHAEAIRGTFQEAWGRGTRSGQRLESSFDEPSAHRIRLQHRKNFVRQTRLEQI